MSQTRFQKRQREKAKQEKAEAKRERRAERARATEEAVEGFEDPEATAPEADVLEQLAELHERFAGDRIGFDAFEEQKQALMVQLEID